MYVFLRTPNSVSPLSWRERCTSEAVWYFESTVFLDPASFIKCQIQLHCLLFSKQLTYKLLPLYIYAPGPPGYGLSNPNYSLKHRSRSWKLFPAFIWIGRWEVSGSRCCPKCNLKIGCNLGAVHKLRHAWLGEGKSKKTFGCDAVANGKNWAWREPKIHWK